MKPNQLLLLFLCLCPLAAYAQTAEVGGAVQDQSGAVIPKASVEFRNQTTGVRRQSTTNGDGAYHIEGIDPGKYDATVQAKGFKTLTRENVVFQVGDKAHIDFKMQVGDAGQTVTVDGSGQQINTIDGSVSTVIDRDFVENMPLNGRSFQNLLTLSPGVSQVVNSGGFGAGYSGDIVVNGQRTESNYYTVDGVTANTGMMPGQIGGSAGSSGNLPSLSALGTTQGIASIDDLQEFRSTTSTYSAEYGRSPGGQFTFSTRSGTNAIHGSLYDYLRNTDLDASNWFNDYYGYPKGEEHQNDFGGTFGGPLIIPHAYNGKSKSFFFFSYEGLRLVSPQAATPVEVPDNCLRGITSACTMTGGSSAPAALLPLLNAFPVMDDGEDGNNDGFGYYLQSISFPSTLNNTSIRLDHTFGNKLNIFGRYADTPSTTAQYLGSVEQVSNVGTQTVTLGATTSLSSHQTNDLRFNFTQNSGSSNYQSTALGGATPFNVSSMPGPNNQAFPQSSYFFSVPFIFANDTTFKLQNLPDSQHQVNITDTHSWLIGTHSVKVGMDWRRLLTQLPAENPTTGYVFTSEAQVLANQPLEAVVELYGTSKDDPVYQNFSVFAQDEWKATPRLALSLGLRWDINPAPTNSDGPAPYTLNQITNLATAQLAPQGTPLWKTDWSGFAPRVGVAYQLHPASEHGTVLRAGFGMFYDAGNTIGSAGYTAIGFVSEKFLTGISFPLTSPQLSVPAPNTTAPYSTLVAGFDPNLKLPYSLQYSAAIEQALSRHESLTISYIGSGGRKLLTEFYTYPGQIGNPNFGAYTEAYIIQGRASSSYNSFQAKYQRALSHGLQTLVSYTWSHSIDNSSNNFYTYYLLRASSDFDIRHNLQAAVTYEVPKPNSLSMVSPLLSNWGLDLRFQTQTALPVDIIGDQELDVNSGSYVQYQANRVPGQPLYLYGSLYPGGRIINYDAFSVPAAGANGDLPRNYARAFGTLEFDTAVRRDIPIHDQFHLQFRAEAFNVFNHPMFGPIYNTLSYGPSYFGYAYDTFNTQGNLNSLYQVGGPRSLQLSLKASF